MTHVTCRLTAKNRDRLRNPTLGNRVWATFTFIICTALVLCMDHATWGARVNTDTLRLAQRLRRHGLDFRTVWCTMRLIGVEKDWKHVLMQKAVTLNTCCDIACLTFQLPHITAGSFHSHRWQPTTGFLQSLQRLKERNKPSVRWRSFAIHELVWWQFQVGWASGL